jgi:hypothetical protein
MSRRKRLRVALVVGDVADAVNLRFRMPGPLEHQVLRETWHAVIDRVGPVIDGIWSQLLADLDDESLQRTLDQEVRP